MTNNFYSKKKKKTGRWNNLVFLLCCLVSRFFIIVFQRHLRPRVFIFTLLEKNEGNDFLPVYCFLSRFSYRIPPFISSCFSVTKTETLVFPFFSLLEETNGGNNFLSTLLFLISFPHSRASPLAYLCFSVTQTEKQI